jgi:hypothetical protein
MKSRSPLQRRVPIRVFAACMMIFLTPLACLYWYMGGSLAKNSGDISEEVSRIFAKYGTESERRDALAGETIRFGCGFLALLISHWLLLFPLIRMLDPRGSLVGFSKLGALAWLFLFFIWLVIGDIVVLGCQSWLFSAMKFHACLMLLGSSRRLLRELPGRSEQSLVLYLRNFDFERRRLLNHWSIVSFGGGGAVKENTEGYIRGNVLHWISESSLLVEAANLTNPNVFEGNFFSRRNIRSVALYESENWKFDIRSFVDKAEFIIMNLNAWSDSMGWELDCVRSRNWKRLILIAQTVWETHVQRLFAERGEISPFAVYRFEEKEGAIDQASSRIMGLTVVCSSDDISLEWGSRMNLRDLILQTAPPRAAAK